MRALSLVRRVTCLLAVGVAAQFTGLVPAGASVISASPTLPLLGVPYSSAVGAGCFPALGMCIQPGSLTLSGPVQSSFNTMGHDITTNASYVGVLTDLNNVPTGPITLTGTVEQEVLGRTFSTETGSWETDLLAFSLSGPLLGHNLTLGLSTAQDSSGVTSITPLGGASDGAAATQFQIDSFFDILVDLSFDMIPPLHATRSIHAVAAGAVVGEVPEPASLVVLATGLAGLRAARRRRQPVAVAAASINRRRLSCC